MFARHAGDIANQIDIALTGSVSHACHQLRLIIWTYRIDEECKGGSLYKGLSDPWFQHTRLSQLQGTNIRAEEGADGCNIYGANQPTRMSESKNIAILAQKALKSVSNVPLIHCQMWYSEYEVARQSQCYSVEA
jgi:hypothetical protein